MSSGFLDPIEDMSHLFQVNQPQIPQDYRQLGHRGLLLAGDQREGGVGDAQVLLKVADEAGVVHGGRDLVHFEGAPYRSVIWMLWHLSD